MAWLRKHPTLSALLLLALATLAFLAHILFPASGYALGGDGQDLFVPWLTIFREAVRAGRLPLWDARQFAGYPFLSNPQVGIFYPLTWLAIMMPVTAGISWYVAIHIWLAGLGMWLFVRSQKSHWLGATLAALAFSFSGFAAARAGAGHIGLLATNAWLPWMLLGLSWSVRRKDWRSGVIAGLPIGLSVLAGHSASLIYLGVVLLSFALYLGWREGGWGMAARQLAVSGLVGLAVAGVQLLPLLELSRHSTRVSASSFEFATDFSFPPGHLISLIIPEFFGEPTRAGYWSVPNFAELTYYVGILPFLGLLLAIYRPSRLAWFYLGLIILGFLLALGRYGIFFRIAYDWLPPFRLVRAPGRAMFLYTFAASALLAEVVSVWSRGAPGLNWERRDRFLRGTLIVIAITGTLVLAVTGALFAAQHPSETSGRLWHQLGGWASALLLALAGIVLLRAYFVKQYGRPYAAAALLLLMLVDLWSFGYKLVVLEPSGPQPLWRDTKAMVGDSSARVLPWGISIFDQNGAGQAGLSSVFGYNTLELANTTALAASVADPRSTAYDILGAGYVVAYGPLDQYADGQRPLRLVDHTDAAWVYQRSRVLPMVRLVYEWEVIEDAAVAIARVHEADFDPAVTAILDQPPDCRRSETPPGEGSARIVERTDGYWQIETESPEPSLLVVSESAYPGWQVTVDGGNVPSLTAYTAVRATCVPAGKHTVEWIYVPQTLWIGSAVSIVGLFLLLTAVGALRRGSGS